ncbi:MAG: nitrate reductase, partial [Comamonadaceae bacterium]|nr:nitrate reductase [Comamonadaceae bacterium]
GFLLSRRSRALPEGWWWARVAAENGTGRLVAAPEEGKHLRETVRAAFGLPTAEFFDDQTGFYRAAWLDGDKLDAALFLSPEGLSPDWDALTPLIGRPALNDDERRLLLSGRSADGFASAGPLVCACFGVGLAAIMQALGSGAATSVEAIGRHLKAGTNCGSCLPELKKIVAVHGATPASAAAVPLPTLKGLDL